MKLDLHEVAQVVGAQNNYHIYPNISFKKIEFDSRLIAEGDLFFPLKGVRDGHDFIAQALKQGAAATLSEKELDDPIPYLLVEDVLEALQTLAHYYVQKMAVDVLAVTGSNGKTTTKDMLAHLLATTYKTYKTQGNYNNEIGLPYTILHMPDETEKLVLEMGQDHLGDIHLLSMIAEPKVAIVTLVAEAHLEFFKSRSEIAKGKMQIADGLIEDGLFLLPNDELVKDYLPSKKKLVFFGEEGELFLTHLEEYKDFLTFSANFLHSTITVPVTGKYNATNAMLASYVALQEGVSEQDLQKAFSNLKLTRNRTEWKKAANGADILSDVYNANPTAMRLILETFSAIPVNEKGRKLIVLGDMKELGNDSKQMHAGLITSLHPDILSEVFLYGEDMHALYEYAKEIFPPQKVHFFKKTESDDQFEELFTAIQRSLSPSDQILLKGSHSMNLSDIVERLLAEP